MNGKDYKMKTIVVYKSKTGYTKTYAEWIAQELKCELASSTDMTVEKLKEYDTIIYGGGIYAIGINGISLLTKNFEVFKNKNIIVWATGLNPGREEELNGVWAQNFTKEQRSVIKTFYLRGGFDYTKLSVGNKVLMNMLKVKLKHTKDKSEDVKGLLSAYDIPEYHCSKDNIGQIVAYVSTL